MLECCYSWGPPLEVVKIGPGIRKKNFPISVEPETGVKLCHRKARWLPNCRLPEHGDGSINTRTEKRPRSSTSDLGGTSASDGG